MVLNETGVTCEAEGDCTAVPGATGTEHPVTSGHEVNGTTSGG